MMRKEAADAAKIPAMEESLGFLLRDTSRVFADALHARLRAYGLSIAHWQYLRVLWERDGITQRELAQRAKRMGASTVSALDGMQRSKMVRRVRSVDDRREVHIFLTKKGKSIEVRAAGCVEKVHRIATRGLSDKDIAIMKLLLRRMRGNIEAENLLCTAGKRRSRHSMPGRAIGFSNH